MEKENSSKCIRSLAEGMPIEVPLGNSNAAIPQVDVKVRFVMGERKP